MKLNLKLCKLGGIDKFICPCVWFLLFVVGWHGQTCLSVAQQDFPVPAQYVEDKAGIINHTIKERLNAHLKELEQKTGAQLIVLTVKSTEGMPIEKFAFNLASK